MKNTDFQSIVEDIIDTQVDDRSCGPASLSFAASKLGVKVSQGKIKELANTNKDGTKMTKLVEAAKKIGLSSEIHTSKSLDELGNLVAEGNAVILDYMDGREKDDGHYSVLERVDKDFIVLQDPAYIGSVRVIPKKSFERSWYDFENGKRVDNWALVLSKK